MATDNIPNSQYIRTEGYIHRSVADSHVLISVGNNMYKHNGFIEISETAALIWDALNEAQTLYQLAHLITEKFDIDFDTAYNDTIVFVNQLVSEKMVYVLK